MINSFNKKIFFIIFVVSIIFLPSVQVIALNNKNLYHENRNGLKITEKEYNIISKLYGEDYFESMTEEDYEWLSDLNINSNNDIEIISVYNRESDNFIMPLGSTFETPSNKLTLIKSCTTSRCTIVTTNQWLQKPVVKSYDVIGARFQGTSLDSDSITTRVKYGTTIESFNDMKKYATGFGVSVKVPDTDKSIIVEQKFYVKNQGTIFASYQHAIKNISLETSKLYRIDVSGYGNVFQFYGSATNAFSQMNGVSTNLN